MTNFSVRYCSVKRCSMLHPNYYTKTRNRHYADGYFQAVLQRCRSFRKPKRDDEKSPPINRGKSSERARFQRNRAYTRETEAQWIKATTDTFTSSSPYYTPNRSLKQLHTFPSIHQGSRGQPSRVVGTSARSSRLSLLYIHTPRLSLCNDSMYPYPRGRANRDEYAFVRLKSWQSP